MMEVDEKITVHLERVTDVGTKLHGNSPTETGQLQTSEKSTDKCTNTEFSYVKK